MAIKMPTHVGLIIDGNRRWAKANGLSKFKGHEIGYRNLKTISDYLLGAKKIKFVSAFIFSAENWNRSKTEVTYLMRLVTKALDEYLAEFQQKGVKIVILGNRSGLNPTVLKTIDKAESQTASNQNGT